MKHKVVEAFFEFVKQMESLISDIKEETPIAEKIKLGVRPECGKLFVLSEYRNDDKGNAGTIYYCKT